MWRRTFDGKMLAMSWVVVIGMLTALALTFAFAALKTKGWLLLVLVLVLLCCNLAAFGLGLHYVSRKSEPVRALDPSHVRQVLRRREGVFASPNPQPLTTRLEALESLIEAPSAEFLPLAVPYIANKNAHLRTLSARAVGRCFAQLSPQEAQHYAWPVAQTLIEAFDSYNLSRYVLLESLLLMEQNAEVVLRNLFTSLASQDMMIALLDAPNPWPVSEATDYAVDGLSHPDPEMQAVSLRYFGRLLYVPPEARNKVVALLVDPVFFVRLQALKLTPLLGQTVAIRASYDALGDATWWVRKRASTVLQSLEEAGINVLEYAKTNHPDAFARDAAANQLLEIELEQRIARDSREVLV
jgi:hypothetical protein